MEDTRDDARSGKENIENICIYKDNFSGGSKKNIENVCIYKDVFFFKKSSSELSDFHLTQYLFQFFQYILAKFYFLYERCAKISVKRGRASDIFLRGLIK